MAWEIQLVLAGRRGPDSTSSRGSARGKSRPSILVRPEAKMCSPPTPLSDLNGQQALHGQRTL